MNKKEDVSFLLEMYDRYFNTAKKAEEIGNNKVAKENYYLAAQVMVKIAKQSTDKVREARIKKAQVLIQIADQLDDSVPVRTRKTPAQGNKDSNQTEEKDCNEFEAAEIPNIHFSDIIGLQDVKDAITLKMINPIKYPEKYKMYNKNTGGGVLLYGPPGTGKTMIAKAIACEVGAYFYAIKSSDIVSKWVGESEKNIAALFETANSKDRAIIFIDEMDSLFMRRGEDKNNDKRVNEFLQQMDGFAGKNPNLLILGATNRPWDIDSAATRSGRFSEKIYVHLPDVEGRKFMFKKYLANIPLASDVNYDELAKVTEFFSGADISEVCDKAKDPALNESIRTNQVVNVSQRHIMAAIRHVGLNINKGGIEQFEIYAKRNSNLFDDFLEVKEEPKEEPKKEVKLNIDNLTLDQLKKEEPKQEIKEEPKPVVTERPLELIFKEEELVYVPDKKYSLEFYLSERFDKVYIKIDTKNVVCKSNIMNWVSNDFIVSGPGEYKVDIVNGSNDKVISSKIIKFTGGIEENDLGV